MLVAQGCCSWVSAPCWLLHAMVTQGIDRAHLLNKLACTVMVKGGKIEHTRGECPCAAGDAQVRGR
jgi:hypothetical protein